jgi:UDP-2,3-diacylglucosamine hydrolase
MTTPRSLPSAETAVSAPAALDARGWNCIDFISDLHLCEQHPRTFDAWRQHLETTSAQALFILGDLFEVWVGDDVLDDPSSAFERACVDVLRHASQRMAVHFMCGNRDFLAGDTLMQRTGMHALNDPTLLQLERQRVLLSHGDAWCLDDHDYLAFRAEVRSPVWQQKFLARPLSERLALAREMRSASESRKRTHASYADVDDTLASKWLMACEAQTLVHGHTHRPTTHALPSGHKRWVLSDWEADATPPRQQVLRWQGEWQRIELR